MSPPIDTCVSLTEDNIIVEEFEQQCDNHVTYRDSINVGCDRRSSVTLQQLNVLEGFSFELNLVLLYYSVFALSVLKTNWIKHYLFKFYLIAATASPLLMKDGSS